MSTKQNRPFMMDVKAGDYYWCSCGESSKQPFCDGSHAKGNAGKQPLKTTVDVDKKVAWCGCKESGSKPFCDGSHSKLK